MKKNKNLYFTSIFYLLSTFLCIYRGDGIILLDLKGEALDVVFKVIKEDEYSITYRLDVN